MLQSTSPIASLFISLHHNVSGVEPTRESPKGEPFFYEAGWKDACAVFFYSLVCIVMHAILQEYFLDVSINNFLTAVPYCMLYLGTYLRYCNILIIHAPMLQKISKKFHLSKSKLSALNESGQLVVFHLVTLFWGFDAILREGFLVNISKLWDGNKTVFYMYKFMSDLAANFTFRLRWLIYDHLSYLVLMLIQ